MCLCARMLALEWKGRLFIEKVNSRCFCWFPAAILVHQNGAPIWRLHTKLYKVRETFRQITQKLWATKTWDLHKFFKNQSFITFHFLGFFPWTVYNLFFSCLTLKKIYRTKQARLILQSGTIFLLPIFQRHGLLFSGVLHTW